MSSKRILLVEDEAGLVLTLTDRLEMQGYAVESAADGAAGLEKALSSSYDLIILDVMLPQMNGFEVCRKLREHGSMVPILMLTARGQLADKVHGLKTGADDYLTKPYKLRELVARVRALLRRAYGELSTTEADQLFVADLVIDRTRAGVTRGGQAINLTPTEFRLLVFLAQHPGQVLSRGQIMEQVWGHSSDYYDDKTVNVHIRRLREKIELDPSEPRLILTVPGMGYRLAVSG